MITRRVIMMNGTMSQHMLTEKEEVFLIFRKLIFVLYVEIGALRPEIHPELAAKADIRNVFFHGEKQKQAAFLYHQTEFEEDIPKILAPYQEKTGLSLEDIHRAFVEGNWQVKNGGYHFGGPRLVKIAEAALELRDLLEREDWEDAALLVYKIKKLKTNQGFLVNQFEWTERRRP
jgi:hypothetical protein